VKLKETGEYKNLMKFINTYPEVMISNRNQTCVYLPKVQPETESRSVHISYFLQNCKKGKPCRMDLPLLKKRYHKYFRPLIFKEL
jgi:hypothetical protein